MKESTLLKSKMKIEKKNTLLSKFCKKDRLEVVFSFAILLLLWQIIALKINNDIYLPTIGQVYLSMKEIIQTDRFQLDVLYSIGRCVLSFLFALLLAIILGIISYISRLFRNFLKPINSLAKSIPTMVLVVLSLIWFDKDNTPFIVGFAIVFPILYDSVLGSIMRIDKQLLEMAKLYRISMKDKILKIYFPIIKFQLISILVSTFSLALKVVIAGEVHGQPTYGMGTMIQVEKINFNTSGIFAWVIIIILISALLDISQNLLLRRTFIWRR